MFNIHFMGKYVSEEQLINGKKISPNAVQFDEGDDLNEAFVRGMKITIPILVIVIFLSLRRCENMQKELSINLTSVCIFLVMILVAYFMKYVHEFIHALVYPISENKYIYTNLDKGVFLIYCDAKLTKSRFLLINFAPVALQGFLIYGIWYVIADTIRIDMSISILFLSWYMIMFAAIDFYNIYYAIFKVPRNANIFNYGLHSYWISNN